MIWSWLIPHSPSLILDQKWFELNLFPPAMNGWPTLTSSVICTLRWESSSDSELRLRTFVFKSKILADKVHAT